jgi:hypothetical protein
LRRRASDSNSTLGATVSFSAHHADIGIIAFGRFSDVLGPKRDESTIKADSRVI